jgi:hypothetical protein
MRSIWATRLTPPDSTQIRPTLNRFADECRGMLVHLAAYLGVLALLVITGAHLWWKLPDSAGVEPAAKAGWNLATRSYPAFAVSRFDLYGKQRLTKFSGIPRVAARTSCGGRPRAKNRSQNSKSIGLAGNRADPEPESPKSPPAWGPKTGANWKRPGSSRANSARSHCFARRAMRVTGALSWLYQTA